MNPEKRALVALLTQQQRILDLEQEVKNQNELLAGYIMFCKARGYEVLRCDDCLQVFFDDLVEHPAWRTNHLCTQCRDLRRQESMVKAFEEGRVSVRQ